jgi:hypothetical protein
MATQNAATTQSTLTILQTQTRTPSLTTRISMDACWVGGTGVGLNYDILDTMAVVGPMVPALRNRRASSGKSIWCEGDGVHLSRERPIWTLLVPR